MAKRYYRRARTTYKPRTYKPIPKATKTKNCATCSSLSESFGKKGGCFFSKEQIKTAYMLRCANWEQQ